MDTLPPGKALTIAGSDSGGGAGIQADLKTFTSLEVYGTSIITSVTSQNTLTVDGIHSIPGDFVSQQLSAVLSDIGSDSIKTGMLSNAEIISSVGKTLLKFYPVNNRPIRNFVVDPVMISSTGAQLLECSGIRVLITDVFPLCHILTPNVPEALKLLEVGSLRNEQFQTQITSVEEMKMAARALTLLGPTIVLLKGGHLPFYKASGKAAPSSIMEDISAELETPMELVDLVYDSRTKDFTEFRKPFLRVKNTHGTGCTLSAAISAYLARGCDDLEAIKKGLDYVEAAMRTSFSVGKGKGPLNHFHGIIQRSLELPSKSNPNPLINHLIKSCHSEWKEYMEHPFVQRIGDGTLPKESFLHYIIQDYFFLQNYARAHAMGAYKSKLLAQSKEFADTVIAIAHETKLHIHFCEKWGVSFEQIQATPESMANVAYTRYVLDIGASGDILDLNLAMAPCSIGYGEIGRRLINDPKTVKGPANPYWEWIELYAGEDYNSTVAKGVESIEKMAVVVQPSPHRLRQMEKIFRQATLLEAAFWEMGLQRT